MRKTARHTAMSSGARQGRAAGNESPRRHLLPRCRCASREHGGIYGAAGRRSAHRSHPHRPKIKLPEASDPARTVTKMVGYRKQYDQGGIQVKPDITRGNVKLFLHGVIAAPALTGAVLEPYPTNAGT